MRTETVYEVMRFIEGYGPAPVFHYKTIEEAKTKYKSEKFVLEHLIMEALELKDEDALQNLKRQTLQLNEATITYNDNGELELYHSVKIMCYGTDADWEKLRADHRCS